MKKTLLAIAALAATVPALAQSSVTVYGVIDLGVRSIKNDGYSTDTMLVKDGSGTSSRLGFKGVEDLGGGLKASFQIESAVNADEGLGGSGTKFWDRQSTLSLSGNWGEVRLGRAKTSNRLVLEAFDPWGAAGMPDVSRIYSSLKSPSGVTNRTDNQIAYLSPNMGGFYGSLDVSEGKTITGRLGYKAGALHVAAGYGEADNPGTDKYKLGTLGASYDFGFLTPSLSFSQGKFMSYEQNVWQIGLQAPLAGGTLRASYAQSDVNAAAEAAGLGDGKLFAIGYLYPLSKRTALYGNAAVIDNSGLAKYTLGGSATSVDAGGKSTGFDLGVRHSF